MQPRCQQSKHVILCEISIVLSMFVSHDSYMFSESEKSVLLNVASILIFEKMDKQVAQLSQRDRATP